MDQSPPNYGPPPNYGLLEAIGPSSLTGECMQVIYWNVSLLLLLIGNAQWTEIPEIHRQEGCPKQTSRRGGIGPLICLPSEFTSMKLRQLLHQHDHCWQSGVAPANQKKRPKRKVHGFHPFLWILVFFLRKTSAIHIELLFRNAPVKSSWTDLSLV